MYLHEVLNKVNEITDTKKKHETHGLRGNKREH